MADDAAGVDQDRRAIGDPAVVEVEAVAVGDGALGVKVAEQREADPAEALAPRGVREGAVDAGPEGAGVGSVKGLEPRIQRGDLAASRRGEIERIEHQEDVLLVCVVAERDHPAELVFQLEAGRLVSNVQHADILNPEALDDNRVRSVILTGRRSLLLGALGLVACRSRSAVHLWLGGDLHLGEVPGPVTEGLAGVLASAVGVANLEGPVGEAPPCAEGRVCLGNARERLVAARRAGLSVLGIANNHALDRGRDGQRHTAAVLRELGFGAMGGPAGPAYVVRGGRGVAITAHDLGKSLPSDLERELSSARHRVDDLVATFHVTGPPSYLPRPVLREAVEVALGAGARVVASHGSHALGPIERRGEAVVAWGLGNLRFACDCTTEVDALLLRLELGDGPVKVKVIPIDAGLGGASARPASDPGLTMDLLEALGSTPLERDGATAWLV